MLSNCRMHSSYSVLGHVAPLGAAEDQQSLSTAQQVYDLVTGEVVAVCAVFHSALYGARSSLAHSVGQPAVAQAAIAPDVFRRILLVTEDSAPSVHQLLSDGRVIGSGRTQVAVVPAVANHRLCHLRYPSGSLTWPEDTPCCGNPSTLPICRGGKGGRGRSAPRLRAHVAPMPGGSVHRNGKRSTNSLS